MFDYRTLEQEKKQEIKCLGEKRSFIEAIEKAEKAGRTPVISEVKRASPSKGRISLVEPETAAKQMEKGGACCISVLTDKRFDGKICHLRQVKNAVSIPVLRKDFIVDEFQLHESRGNGADAVLLIAALLKEKTPEYVDNAKELGLEALVEVHDLADLEYALSSKSPLIGINNRDLRTMNVSLSTTEQLAPMIPKNRLIVSESGVATKQDIERLKKAGVRAFLVGTSVMSSGNIEAKVRELVKR